MKARRILLIVLIVGGFWYLTSHSGWLNRSGIRVPLIHDASGGLDSPLELTEAHAQPAYDSEELGNISVYKKALPSVVNIIATAVSFDFFYGVVPQQGQGSGFILDKQGHILTNYHVVADARQVEVTLSDKRKFRARVVGRDQSHDLALLQIDAPNLVPSVLSDSKDLTVGQKVYAIGNPFGLSGTMTTGIISAIRSLRTGNGNTLENAIQTDAAINPGNSGGPLLNSRAEVIGINSMIASNGADQSSGIGFAIPINTAKAVLADFLKYGRVRRPSMGIESIAIGPDLAQQMGLPAQNGVLIQRTVPGGPAERAGLRGGTQREYVDQTPIVLGGDLIVGMDGQQVTSGEDINEVLNRHEAGDTINVVIFRGRRQMTLQVTLGEARQRQT